MTTSRSSSVLDPPDWELAKLAVEASRRAEAMGIVEPGDSSISAASIRQLASRVRRAGIGTSAADMVNNVEEPSNRELMQLLEMLIAALDASPVPRHEWKGLARVFSAEELGGLLDISLSSLKRYQSGERDTPDPIAARLHFLALVVGDLAGSYNEAGIRRWFQRKRTQLDDRSPASFLKRNWDPDDEGPRRVRALARSLVTLSVT